MKHLNETNYLGITVRLYCILLNVHSMNVN